MYDLKTSELPIAGYTLTLRAPTLHQHKAVINAFNALNFGNVLATIQPAIDAAKSTADGSIVEAVVRSLPQTFRALREEVLENGVEAVIEAAAVMLDSRTNHRRLSAPCPDADFDDAQLGDFEPGPDGSTYLECQRLRAFVRANITTDAAFWTLMEAVALGGYAQMGKALVSMAANGLRTAGQIAPATPTTKTAPITA